jgi:hypothetical protein
MPIPDNEEHARSDAQDDTPFVQNPPDENDDESSAEDMSEVAKRITLLGKLVIPPSTP